MVWTRRRALAWQGQCRAGRPGASWGQRRAVPSARSAARLRPPRWHHIISTPPAVLKKQKVKAMLKGADAAVLHALVALGLQSRVVRVWGLEDDVSSFDPPAAWADGGRQPGTAPVGVRTMPHAPMPLTMCSCYASYHPLPSLAHPGRLRLSRGQAVQPARRAAHPGGAGQGRRRPTGGRPRAGHQAPDQEPAGGAAPAGPG